MPYQETSNRPVSRNRVIRQHHQLPRISCGSPHTDIKLWTQLWIACLFVLLNQNHEKCVNVPPLMDKLMSPCANVLPLMNKIMSPRNKSRYSRNYHQQSAAHPIVATATVWSKIIERTSSGLINPPRAESPLNDEAPRLQERHATTMQEHSILSLSKMSQYLVRILSSMVCNAFY